MITCKPPIDCTDCTKRYEVETERGIEQRCTDNIYFKSTDIKHEWIYISHNPCYSPFDGGPLAFYRCSGCGYITGNKSKYCPECGVRMS